MAQVRLTADHLITVIGDNEAHDQHAAGYNGVHHLSAPDAPDSLFVPRYAGLNFEHIFDGHEAARATLFEARQAPMSLSRGAIGEVVLHQPPTPHYGLESWTTLTVREPWYLDFEFRCIPRQDAYRYGYIGLFWASYIDAPENKSIYFRGERVWHQYCTQVHDHCSTVRAIDDDLELPFSEDHPPRLYNNYSPLRFERAFYYGLARSYVYLVMFEPGALIRFSHSPSGGGATADGSDTNPAWDFQYLIPEYRRGKRYGFRARVVYKPYAGRADLVAEYESWLGSLR